MSCFHSFIGGYGNVEVAEDGNELTATGENQGNNMEIVLPEYFMAIPGKIPITIFSLTSIKEFPILT